ncbi:50S ribosomal protein L24 [candidate division WS6 bacterium RIFOXYD1_FULL_33_8]|uniref:Large ribosomal subunit protein uL24 n=2 Tax=Candidatus Dojkabacteria TaxID=74243 RepID=A0A0G0ADI3_9BACT|nr:ribosomal protein L24 [uncultured bacterium]KKP42858.1 MAG: ribosomal protein L24, large subunit ribosomal protein L24 [candidate division WS6 bacterium GW2011_GWE2_33_157]KKP44556.1 MAG: ribosomal protein L24, large subunit ribosomal protein L24 [candidate division WS6 bacterium GW2011_GWC1_33_20]KKP46134.1 MAG: ribosomal protein L24, large subunit ribosomal protein L24 [candidate division WS6 bacterium GW2011_GWF1_33_233]KKP54653.1 MAG: 50S ribosomal protein L24 [candidate division WS6 bac
MKIKKGDTVKILYGKDSGKQGTVVALDIKNRKVVVENMNLFKKHVKGDGRKKTSEILTITKPMDASKVMVVCNHCGKPTRIGIKRESDKIERVCKKCGKYIEVIEKKVEEKKEVKKVTKKKTTKVAEKKTVKTTKKKVTK